MKRTISEFQLRQIVAECAKRALNEISPDSAAEVVKNFANKHGFRSVEYDSLPHVDDAKPGQRAKDNYGNPGIKRHNGRFDTDASRYRRIDSQIDDKRYEESLQDPIVAKAQELYNTLSIHDFDYDVYDRVDTYTAGIGLFTKIKDEDGGEWIFEGDGEATWEGGWRATDVMEMRFTAPDGTEGNIPRP